MRRLKSALLAGVLAAIMVVPAVAVAKPGNNGQGNNGQGNNGQGVPAGGVPALWQEVFELQGVTLSLQQQIDFLRGRVDTLEEDVAANQNAITLLQLQDQVLQGLIDQNTVSIADIYDEIDRLKQRDVELEGLIADNAATIANNANAIAENADGIADNADVIAGNADSIELLQQELQSQRQELNANKLLIFQLFQAIDEIENNFITVTDALQDQIDDNAGLIASLQNNLASLEQQMALKQHIINGTCPTGQAIREVRDDGSVICDSAATYSGDIYVYKRSLSGIIYTTGGGVQPFIWCDAGDIPIYGSRPGNPNYSVASTTGSLQRGWQFTISFSGDSQVHFQGYILCLGQSQSGIGGN
jgi:hypothetical protein